MDHKPDWLAWGMHFVVGALIAGFFGFLLTQDGRRRGPVINEEYALLFVVGAILIGGGVSARFGNALWNACSFRVVPPDEAQLSRAMFWACHLCNTAGGALILFALARTYSWLS